MNKYVLLSVLILLTGCVEYGGWFLPPPPFVPGMDGTLSFENSVSGLVIDDSLAWAATPVGVSVSRDVVTISGYDVVWSKGFYADAKVLKQGPPYSASSVWLPFDINAQNFPVRTGWIRVSRNDELSTNIPLSSIDGQDLNAVVVYACKFLRSTNEFLEYDCNGVDGKTVKIKPNGALHSGSGRGSWMLKKFSVAPAEEQPCLKKKFYRDADNDGFGNPSDSKEECVAPAGYIVDNTDCDDGDNTVYPGATTTCGKGACQRTVQNCVDGQEIPCTPDDSKRTDEDCDGVDNDCDGSVDEDIALVETGTDTGE
ncbi:putative metal-binding motif-containing protein, partial [Candidatus Woesearchaeota archaeon]|nr:putative metal-binding motif-containing protein [Candidatus Woesearchaeota archaeon]